MHNIRSYVAIGTHLTSESCSPISYELLHRTETVEMRENCAITLQFRSVRHGESVQLARIPPGIHRAVPQLAGALASQIQGLHQQDEEGRSLRSIDRKIQGVGVQCHPRNCQKEDQQHALQLQKGAEEDQGIAEDGS